MSGWVVKKMLAFCELSGGQQFTVVLSGFVFRNIVVYTFFFWSWLKKYVFQKRKIAWSIFSYLILANYTWLNVLKMWVSIEHVQRDFKHPSISCQNLVQHLHSASVSAFAHLQNRENRIYLTDPGESCPSSIYRHSYQWQSYIARSFDIVKKKRIYFRWDSTEIFQ